MFYQDNTMVWKERICLVLVTSVTFWHLRSGLTFTVVHRDTKASDFEYSRKFLPSSSILMKQNWPKSIT